MKKYIEPKRNSYSLIEFQSMCGNEAACEKLLAFAEQNITVGSTIHSDAFQSYNTLSGEYDVRMEKYDSEDASGHLKWFETAYASPVGVHGLSSL